jgi:hypothetical protein
MFFGLGLSLGNLDATLPTHALASAKVVYKEIGTLGCFRDGRAFLHFNRGISRQKMNSICFHRVSPKALEPIPLHDPDEKPCYDPKR